MRTALTAFLLIVSSTGCSSYTASEMALTTQARKGVAIWTARETARDDEIKQNYSANRKALDEAFDADAHFQTNPTPDWIIESRKAYAAGLDALNQSQSTALAANDAAHRDAAATDAALTQLQYLMSIQLGVESLFEKGIKP
jgi:hypothetical protein